MPGADLPRLLEGLPHPVHEPELFKKERFRRGQVFEIRDSWFYVDPLNVAPSLVLDVLAILTNPATFLPGTPDLKFCGGFHADFAVEWLDDGETQRALLCFGCREVKVLGLTTQRHSDLESGACLRLEEMLKGVRQFRPPEDSKR